MGSGLSAWLTGGSTMALAALIQTSPTSINTRIFFQNQVDGGGLNGWEPTGGWCYQVAYSDAFYDLVAQGYSGVYTDKGVDPTPSGPGWYTAIVWPRKY